LAAALSGQGAGANTGQETLGDNSDESSRRLSAVCIMGPTASGKSDLAIEIARRVPAEIITVDSAQVYEGLDIGSAKPNAALRQEIPHHLLDIRDPATPYSAADFRADALIKVAEIRARGAVPLLTGGTMLYFKALKDGLAQMPVADEGIRREIAAFAEKQGWPAVHKRLEEVDPVAAARIHENDPQRLQRALEVYQISGHSLTYWQSKEMPACPFRLVEIAVIPPDRALLHKKIAARFHQMLELGFLAEVEALCARGDLSANLPAIKAVGYRQAWSYLAGDLSYDEMIERAIIATRQLAKRQYTWLRGWKNIHQIQTTNTAEALKILQVGSILD